MVWQVGGEESHFPFLHFSTSDPLMVEPRLHEKNANCLSSVIVTWPRFGALIGGQGSEISTYQVARYYH